MRCCLLRGRSRSDAGPAKVRISYILIERDKGKPDWLDRDEQWEEKQKCMCWFLGTGKFREFNHVNSKKKEK